MNYLVIFLGGGLGSISRFIVSSFVSRQIASDFPWFTLSVNLIGAFLIGAIVELTAIKYPESINVRHFLVTGFLGGFTTFSAFSLEATLMWSKADYLPLALYITTSVLGTILLVFSAMYLTRMILV